MKYGSDYILGYNGSPFDFGLEYNEGQSEGESDRI